MSFEIYRISVLFANYQENSFSDDFVGELSLNVDATLDQLRPIITSIVHVGTSGAVDNDASCFNWVVRNSGDIVATSNDAYGGVFIFATKDN